MCVCHKIIKDVYFNVISRFLLIFRFKEYYRYYFTNQTLIVLR